jgi:hypothetical protein
MIAVPQAAVDLAKRFEGFHECLGQIPTVHIRTFVRQDSGRLGLDICAIQLTRQFQWLKLKSIWPTTCKRRC